MHLAGPVIGMDIPIADSAEGDHHKPVRVKEGQPVPNSLKVVQQAHPGGSATGAWSVTMAMIHQTACLATSSLLCHS